MISGAHIVLYSRDPQADRAFFRDVLELASVDAGEGWLIFALPPAEAAFHPADESGRHELYLLCEDLPSTVEALGEKGAACGAMSEEAWGDRTTLYLPGGGTLGLYQPKHPRP